LKREAWVAVEVGFGSYSGLNGAGKEQLIAAVAFGAADAPVVAAAAVVASEMQVPSMVFVALVA
jgi:hypothetical protein